MTTKRCKTSVDAKQLQRDAKPQRCKTTTNRHKTTDTQKNDYKHKTAMKRKIEKIVSSTTNQEQECLSPGPFGGAAACPIQVHDHDSFSWKSVSTPLQHPAAHHLTATILKVSNI